MSARGKGKKGGVSLVGVLLELLPAALLCLLFGTVGILHVTSRVMVVRVGYQLSQLEQESRVLAREHDRLKLELATLKNPMRLERAAREKLSMGPPSPGTIITLKPKPPSSSRRGVGATGTESQTPAPPRPAEGEGVTLATRGKVR